MSGTEVEYTCLAIATLCNPAYNTFIPGQPFEVAKRDALPFRHLRNIGLGKSAVVELVAHKVTGHLFALKSFRRYNAQQFEGAKRAFRNEVSIMNRLSLHTHMIQVRATYIGDRELGMVLSPAASDGDLGAYFSKIIEFGMTIEQGDILNRAFGCLASGLSYIHKHTIRHKDIKPQNILVHDGRVIYTDFGISFDADQLDTTTTGYPGVHTRRYCAPEVKDWANRNRKSDVYSLGCVFVEILDVLEPEIGFRYMDMLPYFEKLEEVRRRLVQASVTGVVKKGLLRVAHDMLDPDQINRIDTGSVFGRIARLASPKERPEMGLFCDDCSSTAESDVAATQEELVDEFTVVSLHATPGADMILPDAEIAITTTAVEKRKKKKKKTFLNTAFDNGNIATRFWEAFSAGTPRYHCTSCGEMGHTSSKCTSECWVCGELYHKSFECPNKCWDCDEAGHYARDCPNKCWTCDEVGHQANKCPNECEACDEVGHPTDDCPNRCWTCGELGHSERECRDECFVCGRLGHATQNCVGKCHRCGKIGHWKRDCGDACFECGELGHWAAQCPSKRKKGGRKTARGGGGDAAQSGAKREKQRGWRPIFDQVPKGPYRLKPRRG